MQTPLVEQIASLGVELNANQYKVTPISRPTCSTSRMTGLQTG